jgi:hypothetical protein
MAETSIPIQRKQSIHFVYHLSAQCTQGTQTLQTEQAVNIHKAYPPNK